MSLLSNEKSETHIKGQQVQSHSVLSQIHEPNETRIKLLTSFQSSYLSSNQPLKKHTSHASSTPHLNIQTEQSENSVDDKEEIRKLKMKIAEEEYLLEFQSSINAFLREQMKKTKKSKATQLPEALEIGLELLQASRQYIKSLECLEALAGNKQHK